MCSIRAVLSPVVDRVSVVVHLVYCHVNLLPKEELCISLQYFYIASVFKTITVFIQIKAQVFISYK